MLVVVYSPGFPLQFAELSSAVWQVGFMVVSLCALLVVALSVRR